MSNKLLFRLAVLVAAMMCVLGASAGVDNIITNKVTKESAKDLMAKARVKKDPDNMVKRGDVMALPGKSLKAIDWSNRPTINQASRTSCSLFWDFEDESQAADWQMIDNDGDGHCWEWISDEGIKSHSGSGVMFSASFDNPTDTALTPDNWLISPQVDLWGVLTFWATAQDSDFADEVFAVYVCVGTPNTINNFVKISDDITVTGVMTRYEFDLSAYTGQQGCIAIRHYNVTDMFRLNIDDVSIGEEPLMPYACYTSSNTTLTFYYDDQRDSRPGTTYDLNTGSNKPDWYRDSTNASVTKVVFDPSFAGARPTTTYDWFYGMGNLESITGMSYLNTSEVTNMGWMFTNCKKLTSLDVSHFNTSKVIYMNQMFSSCTGLTSLDLSSFNTSNVTIMMSSMFYNCPDLRTIYVGSGWSTAAVTTSTNMFYNCTSLVGGQGTTYDANHVDKTYAHIDGGPSNPGYLTRDPNAPEAYASYHAGYSTLTFYYDNQKSSRPGEIFDLNEGSENPDWYDNGWSYEVTKVVFDPSFADARPTTTVNWFAEMYELTSVEGIENLNTSEVTDMGGMFWECGSLPYVDVSGFDTHNVTNMNSMFAECYELTGLDVSGFDTRNVTSMESMFGNCSELTFLDVSGFNTAKVTSMYNLFGGCGLTSLDLRSFDTHNVTNMCYMFSSCSELKTIYVGEGWTTAGVTVSDEMFYYCLSIVGGQGTTYDPSNPKDKTYAHIDGGPSNPGYFTEFKEAYACYTPESTTLTFYYDNQRSSRPGTTYDLNTGSNDTGWDTDGTNASVTKVVFDPSFADARPTTTCDWFYGMVNLQSIEGMNYLNTSQVTNMGWMFSTCTKLTNLDVSHFNTSNVTEMSFMFAACNVTSLDLSSFNTSQVKFMTYMFRGSNNLQTIYAGNGWSTAAVTGSTEMFYNCTSLVGGMGTTYDANHVDKTYAHIDGGPSNPGYFTDASVPRAYACYTPSNKTLTFYYDNQRSSRTGTTYDLNTGTNNTGWESDGTNTSVTKVVFDPSFAGARPTTTYDWFYIMSNLQSITGIEYLNTSEVTNMAYMFTYCESLTSLDLSGFNTSQVTDMNYMFFLSSNLRTIYVGDNWSTAAVANSDYMFSGCTSLVGGQGTTWSSSNPRDKTYAHIDGGPSNPGYFTEKPAFLRGDVNGDGSVNISDVTALIDYLLSGNPSGVNLTAADCNQDSSVNISDVTALIDYLLSGTWN